MLVYHTQYPGSLWNAVAWACQAGDFFHGPGNVNLKYSHRKLWEKDNLAEWNIMEYGDIMDLG